MASHFPEPVEIIRNIDPVYWARGGYVYKTTIRLSDGRIVSFYEAMCAGAVTVCDTRPQSLRGAAPWRGARRFSARRGATLMARPS
jgi:hypothetical protein